MQRDGIPGPRLLHAIQELAAEQRAALRVAWRALLVSRLVVWAAGLAAVGAWGVAERAPLFDRLGLTEPFGAAGDLLVAPAARWDSVWFLVVAEQGYGDDPARGAFFPLYPLLAKGTGLLFGSALVGGVVVSLVAFGVALYLLHRLTSLELGDAAARNAVWALALFPMAFFFSAVYSEALFLALSIGAVYAARTDRWAWAGALGLLGAMTRSAGVLLVVPLVLLHVRAHGWRARGPGLAWVLAVPLGLLAFCAFFALEGRDALTPLDAQEAWMRELTAPFAGVWDGARASWQGARQLLHGSRTPVYFTAAGGDPFAVARHNLGDLAFLLAALAAVVGVARRLPLAYAAYVLAALALPLSSPVGPQPLMSVPRFVAVLFPLFMWLGWWTAQGRTPGRRAAVLLALWVIGLAAFTAQFATWHWVA